MKRSLLVSIIIGSVLVFFQNCGAPVNFSNNGADFTEKSSAALVPMELEDSEQDMASSSGDASSVTDEATGTLTQDRIPGQNEDKKNPLPSNNNDNYGDDNEADDDDGADLVACILVDHGKSLKLGLIEQELGGVNSVARSVCISRKGCLEKVAAKFEVQGAYDRGYCKNNPNVVRLSDAELDELLK